MKILSICRNLYNKFFLWIRFFRNTGLKMYHNNNGHNNIKYNGLGDLYYFIALSFEGVVGEEILDVEPYRLLLTIHDAMIVPEPFSEEVQ
jgi:hypothetical protein